MLKKNFLQFLHDDWKENLQRLNDELSRSSDNRAAKLERIRKADEWLAFYAERLQTLYGIEA